MNDETEDDIRKLSINTFPDSKSNQNKECFRNGTAFYYTDRGDKIVIYIPKAIGNQVLQSEESGVKESEPSVSDSNGKISTGNPENGARAEAPKANI